MYVSAGITEDVQANDGSFSLIDEGDYVFTVVDKEQTETKGDEKKAMMKVTFECDANADGSESDQAGKRIIGYYVHGDEKYGKERTKCILQATGVEADEEGGFDDDELVGKQIVASVVHKPVDKKDPDTGEKTGEQIMMANICRERAIEGSYEQADSDDESTEVTEVEDEDLPKSAKNGNGKGHAKPGSKSTPKAPMKAPPQKPAQRKAAPRR